LLAQSLVIPFFEFGSILLILTLLLINQIGPEQFINNAIGCKLIILNIAELLISELECEDTY